MTRPTRYTHNGKLGDFEYTGSHADYCMLVQAMSIHYTFVKYPNTPVYVNDDKLVYNGAIIAVASVTTKFLLRFKNPQDKAKAMRDAEQNGMSMNQWILNRLN
jgi:hypothetical protein